MRTPLSETFGAHVTIRRAGSPLCARWISKRTLTTSSVLAVVDSFAGRGFAGTEDSYDGTNDFAESLKTFPLASGDIPL